MKSIIFNFVLKFIKRIIETLRKDLWIVIKGNLSALLSYGKDLYRLIFFHESPSSQSGTNLKLRSRFVKFESNGDDKTSN